ncbi:hypothetical protein A4X06_0g4881 [Tilletia controversa]|uniref:Tf2-1-like SH3-like domain-containing protein n=2 Tax=Tilletia TaxID=13289 RepID=A0A8X7MSN9_9BASI|nr:hypothetical protein CF336_g9564 [Tilletia laevis]KAE8180796.1 hypothetical protein CF335_g9138 [Tilletia laevis]KAE8188787.1 hypothetical protein CF328_g6491 [Tilletia controversa]KAE8246776.1 hypothetical protein A4X06_0g4881 [Tilletia controversa]KAE8251843.1 hypothetical protein A4X03_0g6304 [Tilletia caries]
MNSTPALSTGFRPFDLVFVAHPDVVHAVFDGHEHSGVSSFEERLSAAAERLDEARRAILEARSDQKRRYDARRSAIPALHTGMMVWVRLRDRPLPGLVRDKLDARKHGPFEVVEVLSAHRVRLRLPADLDVDPVFNVEQLDFAPVEVDPFADARVLPTVDTAALPSGPAFVPDSVDALPTTTDAVAPDQDVVETESVAAASRSRRAPGNLREFQLGTLAPV